MKLATHECPFGLLAAQMLEEAGFNVEQHLLTTRAQVDEFKEQHGVSTTPLVFIDGKKIGGSEQLAAYLEHTPQE